MTGGKIMDLSEINFKSTFEIIVFWICWNLNVAPGCAPLLRQHNIVSRIVQPKGFSDGLTRH